MSSGAAPEPASSWWNHIRPWFIAAACLTVFMGLFYAEEDWRGKRAWENCKREFAARGETLDWNAYIPPALPDEQNIYRAPFMQAWFIKPPFLGNFNGLPVTAPVLTRQPFVRTGLPKQTNVLLAEVHVVRREVGSNAASPGIFRFDPPGVATNLQRLIDEILGPTANGPTGCLLVARPLEEIKPAQLVVESANRLSAKALSNVFRSNSVVLSPRQFESRSQFLEISSNGNDSFRLWLKAPTYGARDYLKWTAPMEQDFDVIGRALERPHARIDGDYQQPYFIPVPNFVRLRIVAQALVERSQCHLLLGESEEAWHDLELIRNSCRLLGTTPNDRPMLLVSAMIETAMTGLYAEVVNDGLRLHVWREPELAAIQRQLEHTELLRGFEESLRTEAAASTHTFESASASRVRAMVSTGSGNPSLWDRLREPLALAPQGWTYQNLVFMARFNRELRSAVNVKDNLIVPQMADAASMHVAKLLSHFNPYTTLAGAATPSISKASQTVARNQTLVNEAQIACALERYRLIRGDYPDDLQTLCPHYIARIPQDIIRGQPLRYRRLSPERFVLYSIGWNEKDDSGTPGQTLAEGDWVWR